MMKHAWSGYEKYAFGSDELKPISRTARNWISHEGLAATLIDSLDTLKIMGLDSEFDRAVDHLLSRVNFDQDADVSFFETTIRVVGGLLAAYDLSQDKRLVKKAAEVADRLMPAFEGQNGLPHAIVNLKRYGRMNCTVEIKIVQLKTCPVICEFAKMPHNFIEGQREISRGRAEDRCWLRLVPFSWNSSTCRRSRVIPFTAKSQRPC